MKKAKIIRAIKYALEMMLILNFALSIIPVLINPEAWLFGHKLGGIKACCWLLANGAIGLMLAYLLFKDVKHCYLAAAIFFLVNFVNVIVIPISTFSPFYFFGVVFSLVGVFGEKWH